MTKQNYKYSFGRKAFFTTLGLVFLLASLIIANELNIDERLYKYFCWGVVGLIAGFGFTNAGISIAHCKNNKSGG
jgi:cell division protein FtsW (lipid II flippase)